MTDPIVVSSQFVEADCAQMWGDDETSYVLAHPDWFAIWNANPPNGKRFDCIFDIDLSTNNSLRSTVFDAWRKWRADQA